MKNRNKMRLELTHITKTNPERWEIRTKCSLLPDFDDELLEIIELPTGYPSDCDLRFCYKHHSEQMCHYRIKDRHAFGKRLALRRLRALSRSLGLPYIDKTLPKDQQGLVYPEIKKRPVPAMRRPKVLVGRPW